MKILPLAKIAAARKRLIEKETNMSFDYIRRYYDVPAKRGGRVAWDTSKGTREGTITSATNYVYVRFDDAKHPVPLHPKETGLRYL